MSASDVAADRAEPPPLAQRVAQTRDALGAARTERQALIALSEADTDTLRAIEVEYFALPGPLETLRDRVAAAHARFVAASGSSD